VEWILPLQPLFKWIAWILGLSAYDVFRPLVVPPRKVDL
jgi:hypothetical protein